MIWPFRQRTAAPSALQSPHTPDGAPRRFVIPDIHGCDLTLRTLIEEVITLEREDYLYLLGDYIDRGPRSREVLDFIMKLGDDGYRVFPLRGNHEDMFLNACADRGQYRTWILNGGYAALDSFGVEDACEVPLPYRRFCSELPYFHLLDDFLLVHAGWNFDAEDPYTDTEAMLWSRTRSVDPKLLAGRTMISGHTPQTLREIEKMLRRNSGLIILDNGCFLAGRKGMGSLLALELNSMTLFSQKNIDIPDR